MSITSWSIEIPTIHSTIKRLMFLLYISEKDIVWKGWVTCYKRSVIKYLDGCRKFVPICWNIMSILL